MINWPTSGNSCSISSRVFCFTYFCTYTQQASTLWSNHSGSTGFHPSVT